MAEGVALGGLRLVDMDTLELVLSSKGRGMIGLRWGFLKGEMGCNQLAVCEGFLDC